MNPPASPRTQLLANFDPLDVQTGEMIAIQASKSRTPAQAASVVNLHLKALIGEGAGAACLAAEEMRVLLNTGKVKKSSALQEWSQALPQGDTLHFATCISHVLGVHGLPGTNVDRAFTAARTRAATLLYTLSENSSANSAALLMHGMVPSSSPAHIFSKSNLCSVFQAYRHSEKYFLKILSRVTTSTNHTE